MAAGARGIDGIESRSEGEGPNGGVALAVAAAAPADGSSSMARSAPGDPNGEPRRFAAAGRWRITAVAGAGSGGGHRRGGVAGGARTLPCGCRFGFSTLHARMERGKQGERRDGVSHVPAIETD